LGNLLYKNKEGVQLMSRIFPKALFKQVVTDKNLCQNYDWSLEEWKEFFQNLSKDYDTAKEQWNAQTRAECETAISQEIADFL